MDGTRSTTDSPNVQSQPEGGAGFSRRVFLHRATTLASVAVIGSGGAATALVRAVGPSQAPGALRAIDPGEYPRLTDIELGLLRWMHKKATLPKGDWSMWEIGEDEGRKGMEGGEADGAQYDGFWTAQAVAVAANKTPAYRQLAQTVLGGLVDKMLDSHVWGYWTENRHGVNNDGTYMPYMPDPVMTANAMYISHFSGVLGYYALMTNDLRYDERPMAFVYEGKGAEVNGVKVKPGTTWHHTWSDLERVVKMQTDADTLSMIPCQLPTRYFICNVGVQQGFLAHDRVYGKTRLSKNSYERGGFWDKVGEEWMVPARSTGLPLQQIYFGRTAAGHNAPGPKVETPIPLPGGKDQAYPAYVNALIATKPDYAHAIYDLAKSRMYTPLPDGTAFWRSPTGASAAAWMAAGVPMVQTTGNSMALNDVFATLRASAAARFVGDHEAADATLAWIEKWCGPTWKDDTLHYSFNYTDADWIKRAGHATSQVLQGHSAVEGGTQKIYNMDRKRFRQPTLTGVEYPTVKVRTATFDVAKAALVVALDAKRRTRVTVENLTPGKGVTVVLDRGRADSKTADRSGRILIDVPAGPHSFVVGTA